jgi:hydrocephalus-inducing protein
VTLIVSSATGGECQCPLVGRCVAPKPQGPIECGKGSGVVAFKNVFPQVGSGSGGLWGMGRGKEGEGRGLMETSKTPSKHQQTIPPPPPQDAEFQYSIDNPAFTVAKATEKIGAKKPTNISVSFKPDPAKGLTMRTGKLTVACPVQTTSPWVFYLQASEGEAGVGKK